MGVISAKYECKELHLSVLRNDYDFSWENQVKPMKNSHIFLCKLDEDIRYEVVEIELCRSD